MTFNDIPSGFNLSNNFNSIIEISSQSYPVKYEINKYWNVLVVDRFIANGMRYPANYGFIPQTLSEDGDSLDVILITPFPLLNKSVIASRTLGMLKMTDECGIDSKIIAVPQDKICPMTVNIKTISDIPSALMNQIDYFFKNYKGLESKKWVKIDGYLGIDDALNEIDKCIKNYESKK